MKKALIFYGGWEGHDPARVSARFAEMLEKNSFAVDRVEGTEALEDGEKLLTYDLIVPCMTMSTLPRACEKNISYAVSRGVGLAGCHGGMCDAFRNSTEWQFITGGQWVAHPGNDGVKYTVNIRRGSSPIIDGIEDFEIISEQYYLHVDPAIRCWPPRASPLQTDITPPTSLSICRWCGQSIGAWAEFIIARSATTTVFLPQVRRHVC